MGRDSDAADRRPTWEEVAERYSDRIYTLAFRLTGNPHDAADLAQDVLVRVLRNLHRYEPGTFDGWLYRVTKNAFLDRVRRERRRRAEALPPDWSDLHAGSEPGPADLLDRRTLEHRLTEALLALPPEFRLAVVLCDVEGCSYDEIAEVTGWPLGTVRSRIHRGRRQLRAILEAPAIDQAAEQRDV